MKQNFLSLLGQNYGTVVFINWNVFIQVQINSKHPLVADEIDPL